MFFIIQVPCISSYFFPPTRQANEIVLFWLLSPLVLVTVFHIRCRRPLVSNGVVHFTPFKVSEILFRPVQASRSMGAIPRFVRLERISLSFCSVALDEYHSLCTLVPRWCDSGLCITAFDCRLNSLFSSSLFFLDIFIDLFFFSFVME